VAQQLRHEHPADAGKSGALVAEARAAGVGFEPVDDLGFVAVAAEILAGRAAMSADDPEPQIAATALLGLWRIQFQGLSKYLDGIRTPAQVHQAVTADVHRVAQLIGAGLSSFAAFMPGPQTPGTGGW
jgi:hypothetical protein